MTQVAPAADFDSDSDSAWVVIDFPLAPQTLAAFCQDLERLYRINPYLEFQSWQSKGKDQIHTVFRNLSNLRELNLTIHIEKTSEFDVLLRYNQGAKRSTHFEIESSPGGSRLRITDDYSHPTSETPISPDDADKSLHAWGVALQAYLNREARWGKFSLWRWYMRHLWIPMKPSARRITFIILMVTLAEIALFVLVMTIYWLERG